jgi:rhamnosyltransferase
MQANQTSVAVVVPTLNAARLWSAFHNALALQRAQPKHILILDSESDDETPQLARAAGYQILSIGRADFNHGGTRQLAANLFQDVDLLVFLTQDAVLAHPDALSQLVESMRDPEVAAAYGRQLPRPGATPIETHARLFNYPCKSDVRTLASREKLGFKAIFISNSFAVYRREALISVGGFPSDVIFGEDTITAGKLLLDGWRVAYVAEAQVYHSHSYSWAEEFRRYFDIGVLHSRESWLLAEFGRTGSEGRRFVASELRYLFPKYWWLVPSSLVRIGLKLLGYRLGRNERRLRVPVKRKLSMQPAFWSR